MADMTTIKGRIAETIYPNGKGAITAESHQALLLEMVDNINEVKQDVLVSGQNIRPLISGESLLGDNALAVLGTRFIYELENQKLFAMIDGALQDLDLWMANRAVHSQVAQVIEIQKEGLFQELVPLTIKNKAGLAALCWEYDGMIYEASMEDDVLAVLSKPKGDQFDKQGNYPLLHVGTADDLAGRGESVPAEFGFRASGGKSIKDGRAYIKRIKGNSVVWNNIADWRGVGNTNYGITVTYDNGYIHVQGVAENTAIPFYSVMYDDATKPGIFIKNHRYMVSGKGDKFYLSVYGDVSITGPNVITEKTGESVRLTISSKNLTIGEEINETFPIRVVDLTKMFGAGNEPTTIEEFNARKPFVEDEYAYNEGQVIHCNTKSIKSVGDNAWDEEWIAGRLNTNTGQPNLGNNGISSKNYIRVLPNETYYCGYNAAPIFAMFYDAEYALITGVNSIRNTQFTTPANAAYMKFYVADDNLATYNNDICIRLAHTGYKTDYEPYWQDILPLPIISKYFPDGMKKAGTAHDEIRYNKASGKWEAVQRFGSVDLGTLTWIYYENFGGFGGTSADFKPKEQFKAICAKYLYVGSYSRTKDKELGFLYYTIAFIKDSSYTDAATFKADMAGVILYYELAEPIVTELDAEDQNFRDYYQVADFGTEQSQSSVPSAPFSADIIYQFNAVDMIREHELEITELQKVIATMQAQLTSLINGGQ